jgi:hypothetical protein
MPTSIAITPTTKYTEIEQHHCNSSRHMELAAKGYSNCPTCRKKVLGFPPDKCPKCFVYKPGCTCPEAEAA